MRTDRRPYAHPSPSMKSNESWRGSACDERLRRLLGRASERRRDWPSATRRRIGEALALRADQSAVGASQIIDTERGPIVVSEIEFGCVTVQMRLAHMEVAAEHAALEDRKVVLDGVGMPELGADIFLGGVVDAPMAREFAPDR